jgi:miniconductance mechanosensitive channel
VAEFETLTLWVESILIGWNVDGELTVIVARAVIVAFILAMSLLANLIAKRVIITVAHKIASRTKSAWDDIIVSRGVLLRLSHIAPAVVIYFLNPLAFPEIEWLTLAIQRLSVAYMIGVTVLVIDAALDAAHDIYNSFSERARERPIKGYIQLAKIFAVVIGAVLIFTTLLDKSPLGILSGIGAMSAVLLLVFRDSILGLVAGIQLSGNKMVRLGDWIEMPKFGADGEVIDITLQSIRVQNWDKTITTIPIYTLVSDSFKNWRGMSESGGRRIKRAIHIDMRTVKFCTAEMVERFSKYRVIEEYVTSRSAEIEEHNRSLGLDESDLVSSRRMTNLGTFRAYVAAYLRSHPKIHQEMTFLIRHLQPGPTGLPIEIYVFSADQAWANFEAIQADIFDHLLAVLPEFELGVFQEPSGLDVQALADSIRATEGSSVARPGTGGTP